MANIVQCPQCGFLEFDEHSGCPVCGFNSRAALNTGHPALKPTKHKLIEFPRSHEVEKTLSPRESGLPDISLPLFDEPGTSNGTPAAVPELVWREELQEKLRQYRERRGGSAKERLHNTRMNEGGEGVSPRGAAPSLNKELTAALDEAFKLHPVAPPLGIKKEEIESSFISARPWARASRPRLPVDARGLEVPESAQTIRQRHPPRQSELLSNPCYSKPQRLHGIL